MSTSKINKRVPIQLHLGKHEPLISLETWTKNQILRQARNHHTAKKETPTRTYLTSQVGKCWECFAQGVLRRSGEFVVLQGSPGGRNGYLTYRCAAQKEQGATKNRQGSPEPRAVLQKIGLQTAQTLDFDAWKSRHQTTLNAKDVDGAVEALVKPLKLPPEWHPAILAYFQDPAGLRKMAGVRFNLEQKREKLLDLYYEGHVQKADFDKRMVQLTGQYEQLETSTFPEKSFLQPYLDDFSTLWEVLTRVEQKNLLLLMFEGLFFDCDAHLRWVIARAPFDQLLGLPPGGQRFPVPGGD